MDPVFPNQQPQAPGGWNANANGQYQPLEYNQPNGGGAAPIDYNVNMGGQMPFDPSAMPMPFDPSSAAAAQPAPQSYGQIGGHMQQSPSVSAQPMHGGGGGGNAWANAPSSSGGWGPGPSSQIGLSGFLDNPLGNMVAGQALNHGKDLYNTQIKRFHAFKYYFAVNNQYVVQKLKILLLPCTHRDWKRAVEPNSQPVQASIELNQPQPEPVYCPPRKDINAPDLYIPAMAFFTFALLMGYVLGTIGKFTPEVVVTAASSTLVTLILEVFVFSVGFYAVDSVSPKLLDLIAWSGYKYVGLIVALIVGLIFGNWAFFIAKFFMGGASGLFLMCTLHRALTPSVEASAGGVPPTSPKRNYFLVIIGACQILLAFFLLRAVVLSPTASPVLASVMGGVPPIGVAAGAMGAAAAGGPVHPPGIFNMPPTPAPA